MKRVLVTGASSGIGAACALRLAKAGHQVVGISRSGTVPVAHERLQARVLDIRDPDAIERGVREIVGELGRLDAVINAAGVAVAGALEDTPMELVRAQLETNLFGATCLIRAVLPYLREAAPSRLIHVSSLAVRVPLPFQALYCASHAGLNGLCEALRYEMEPVGVRVIVIAPGSVRTGLTANRRTAPAGQAHAEAAGRALAANDRDEEGGVNPERIAAAVEKVLLAQVPPHWKSVGHWHERISVPLRGIVPERLFRKIIRSHYRVADRVFGQV